MSELEDDGSNWSEKVEPVLSDDLDDRLLSYDDVDGGGGDGSDGGDSSPITPLPWKGVFVVALILLCDAISLNQIFPYAPFMVMDFYHFDADEKTKIGFYAGFLASSYFVGQLVASFFWGRMSDRLGRRPVMICGSAGTAVAIALFGLSRSFAWAISMRFLHGSVNGNIGVAKTYLAEITDDTNRPRAFALIGFVGGIGRMLGPVIGGFLARPAVCDPSEDGGHCTNPWHDTFDGTIFNTFPYLLPNLIAVFSSCCGVVFGYFFLRETVVFNVSVEHNADEEEAAYEMDVLDEHPLLHHDHGDVDVDDGGNGDVEHSITVVSSPFKENIVDGTSPNSIIGGRHRDEDADDDGEDEESLLSRQYQPPDWILEGKDLTNGVEAFDPVEYRESGVFSHSEAMVVGDGGNVSPTTGTTTNEASVRVVGGDAIKTQHKGPSHLRAQDRDGGHIDQHDELSLWQRLATRQVIVAVCMYMGLGFLFVCWEETYTVWSVQKPSDGGLGFTSGDIGATIAVAGLSLVVYQLLVYPRLAKRLPALTLYRLGTFSCVPVFYALPNVTYALGVSPVLAWILLILVLLGRYCGSITAFTSVFILISNSAPSANLGAVNGLAQTGVAIGRLIGPASAGIILSWSMRYVPSPPPQAHS